MERFDGWDTELYHHGIKGQKWGVRRFQNSDGTLTDEGLRRYTKSKTAAKIGWTQLQADAGRLNSAHAHYGLKAEKYFFKLNRNNNRYARKSENKTSEQIENSRELKRLSKKGERLFSKFEKNVMLQREASIARIGQDKAVLQLRDALIKKYGDVKVKTGYTTYQNYNGTEVPTSVAKISFKR